MDSLEAELAQLRLIIKQANEKFEILDKRISNSSGQLSGDHFSNDNNSDHVDLFDRAEKFLHWGRLKSEALDSGNGLLRTPAGICVSIYTSVASKTNR